MIKSKGVRLIMELNLEQKLGLMLTPQMQQAIKVLQMNNLELDAYLEDLALENPVIELDLSAAQEEEMPQDSTFDMVEWLNSMDENNYGDGFSASEPDNTKSLDFPSPDGETLEECLHVQMLRYGLSPKEQQIVSYLIECLDDNGYLMDAVEDIARVLHRKKCDIEAMLTLLQRCEPLGVGARDLQECLSIQLSSMGLFGSPAYRIVEHHLDDLAQNRILRIAQGCGISVDAVNKARLLILSLNPKPAKSLSISRPQYVYADVLIESIQGNHIPFINDKRIPAIRLSDYYRRLFSKSADKEVKDFLTTKFRQARWVVQCVEQRNSTILLCSEKLIELQRQFFDHGPNRLAPMTLSDISESIGMHVSTVSRAFKGKHLQCTWGLFPFGFFLSQGVGKTTAESISSRTAKAMIESLIVNENKKYPLSDSEIVVCLKQTGVDISRRTVAKYRNEMGVASSVRRKEY